MKYRLLFGLFFAVLLISSCKKEKVEPYIETWKQQNEKAFNDLASNPDFTELKMQGSAASIFYRVIQRGEGKRVFYTSRAEVYYKGWFVVTNEDYGIKAGTVFDQQLFDDGVTFKVAITAQASDNSYKAIYVEGWKIALQYMVEGDKWEIWIPYRLAYQEDGQGIIPGFTTLAFEIELIKAIDLDEYNPFSNNNNDLYY